MGQGDDLWRTSSVLSGQAEDSREGLGCEGCPQRCESTLGVCLKGTPYHIQGWSASHTAFKIVEKLYQF